MKAEKSTSQVLQEARALVAAGWTQGPYYRKSGDQDCYCAMGAVYAVMGQLTGYRYPIGHAGANDALDQAATRLMGTDWRMGSAIAYNEEAGRTQADVLRLFDVALELASK